MLKSTILTLFTLIGIQSLSQIECVTDVVIAEGVAISMCDNALETLNASSGYVSYSWSGPEVGSGQTWTPNFSGQYVVAATDGVGCVSHDTIQVTINPAPVDAIISSVGDTLCPGTGNAVLSLSGAYVLYDWTGGATTPTLTVTQGGQYSVDVADANSCVATFNFTLTELDFDVQSSAGGGCTGAAVSLTASGGTSYLWSTGETGNTIVVSPSATTNFSVQITEGSCMQQLSIPVTVGTPPSSDMPDTLYTTPGSQLIINGPEGFGLYDWTPANVVNSPNSPSVTFTGTQSQLLTVTAVHPDGCTVVDSVMIIVVDLTIPNGFSPNADMINDAFVVPELDDLDGSLTVWNRWGDKVFETEHYENNWAGRCETVFCAGKADLPEGTYFYMIEVEEITFKGYITLKR